MARKRRTPLIDAQLKAIQNDELLQQYRKEKRRIQSLLRKYSKSTGIPTKFSDIFKKPKRLTKKSLELLDTIHSQAQLTEYIQKQKAFIDIEGVPSMQDVKRKQIYSQLNDFPTDVKIAVEQYLDLAAAEIGWEALFEQIEGMEKMEDVDWRAWKYYPEYAIQSTARWMTALSRRLTWIIPEENMDSILQAEKFVYGYMDAYMFEGGFFE